MLILCMVIGLCACSSGGGKETEKQTETEIQTETGSETEQQTETEPVTETEAQTETEPVTETEAQTESEPVTEEQTEPEPVTETQGQTGVNWDSEIEGINNGVITGVNDSAIQLFEAMREKDKNIFISPVSIYLCYSMLYAGADGESKEELARLFNFHYDNAFQTKEAGKLMEYMLQEKEGSLLMVANSMWIRDTFESYVNPDYVASVRDGLKSEVNTRDFSGETAKEINNWVYEHTGKMIDHIIDELSPEDFMVLVNCVFFDGKWWIPFEKEGTHEDIFHSPDGELKVDFMHMTEMMEYFEDDDVQAISMPYRGGQSMVVILPKEGSTESDPLARLGEIKDGMKSDRDVRLSFPKVDIAYGGGEEFPNALKALGVTTMFDSQNDDFYNITSVGAYVGDTLHKTALIIDEEGTKAAAVTSITVKAEAVFEREEPVIMDINRPFYAVILDDATGTVIFCGYIANPTE